MLHFCLKNPILGHFFCKCCFSLESAFVVLSVHKIWMCTIRRGSGDIVQTGSDTDYRRPTDLLHVAAGQCTMHNAQCTMHNVPGRNLQILHMVILAHNAISSAIVLSRQGLTRTICASWFAAYGCTSVLQRPHIALGALLLIAICNLCLFALCHLFYWTTLHYTLPCTVLSFLL